MLTRDARVSGQFYPSNPKELEKFISSFRLEAKNQVSAKGASHLQELLPRLLAAPENRKAGMVTLLQELLKNNEPIRVLYTVGHWLDINNLDDVVQAGSFWFLLCDIFERASRSAYHLASPLSTKI